MIIKKKMKKRMGMVLVLPVLFFVLDAGSPASEEQWIDWIRDQATIDKAALKQKPGMLYFYADPTSSVDVAGETERWDPLMVKLGLPEETLSDKDVVALSRNFSCFSINLKLFPHLFTNYDVWVYPTVIFTDPWGNEVSRASGIVSADALIPLMQVFPTDYSAVFIWNGVLEEDEKNFEALKGMAEFYLELGAWEKSNTFFDSALKTRQARESEETRESIMLVIGLNGLRMREYKAAQKTFETSLDLIRDGKERDKILLGLILAQLGQDKIGAAEKYLKKLMSQHPDSPAVRQAERYIQSVKDSKK
jgi:tetratricopeptide (TPR) repeat protein